MSEVFEPGFEVVSWDQVCEMLKSLLDTVPVPSQRRRKRYSPILLTTPINLFPSLSFFLTSSSTHLDLVPSGSLASNT